jgi:hypothetical protein
VKINAHRSIAELHVDFRGPERPVRGPALAL